MSHYRFSLSWSRILPDGTTKTVNQEGIVYYNRLIDALRTAGIEPVVTLYHWDLPQALQDEGGWINDDVIGFFEAYAGLCYENFGDRVSSHRMERLKYKLNHQIHDIVHYNMGHIRQFYQWCCQQVFFY